MEDWEDEIATLECIYPDQIVKRDNGVVDFRIDWGGKLVVVRCKHIAKYPTEAAPHVEVMAGWLPLEERQSIIASLSSLFDGDQLLFRWMQWLNDTAATKGNAEHSSEEPAAEQQKEKEEKKKEVEKEEDEEEEYVEGGDGSYEYNEDEIEAEIARAMEQAKVFSEQRKQSGQTVVDFNIKHGEPLTDRKSTFQAHVATVTSKDDVQAALAELKENPKIARAFHNMFAYRFRSRDRPGQIVQDCDDDGENAAGGRMLHLLQIVDAIDVLVVVSRWYGGIQLGADRFKHINNCTRDVLEQNGYIADPHKHSKEHHHDSSHNAASNHASAAASGGKGGKKKK